MTPKRTRPIPPIKSWPDWSFLIILFIYPIIVGLLIQLVLLPHVFPDWQVGEGLLKGIDTIQFHRIAVSLSETLNNEGWQTWDSIAWNQPVAGIASVFYAFISPHPWVMLPLNSFLHVLAAWLIYQIIHFFIEQRTYALFSALPFFLFPSSLLWVVQLHNDNYSVTGSILMLYAWVCFARKESWQHPGRIIGAILAMLSGGGLIWMVRDYMVDMFTVIGIILLIALIAIFIFRGVQNKWTWKKTGTAIVVISLSFFILTSLQTIRLGYAGVFATRDYWLTTQENEADSIENQPTRQNYRSWLHSDWLPDWIDKKIRDLSIKRDKMIRQWTDPSFGLSGSNFDTDIKFFSAADVIRYIPRAVEIGLLAPFPPDWFEQGSKGPNTMMRRISGIEMSFIYLCWFGLIAAIWKWRKRPELWAMLFFCGGMLTIYVFGTPNVGTLYRLRYPFIMPLVGIGVAGWFLFFQNMKTLDKVRIFRQRTKK